MIISEDRDKIYADGENLSFITMRIADKNGLTVPDAANQASFAIVGSAEIIVTDNGDPADMTSFASKERKAFSGLVLVILCSQKGSNGLVKVTASSPGLKKAVIEIKTK